MSSESVGANEFPDVVGVKAAQPAKSFACHISAIYSGPRTHIRELTPLPLIVGTLLGMVFGASSLWLVLKVGLTVSASIPVAVISISLFRLLGKIGVREATILENNIVQTAGSAGESIAFGVGVTMPAIMILGFDLEFTRVMLVATMGGLLGILMMIPLRRALIVQQHGILKYPEGTACAEVLKAGASEESRAAADPVYKAKAARIDEADLGREDDLHRFRYRPRLSSCDGGAEGLEGRAEQSFRRAFQSRIACGGDFTGAAGRWLHHWPTHRIDHVRRRRACLPGPDSGDQVLW